MGTRKATAYGKDCVKRILSDLASTDMVVISGLAVGIDTAAHQYALEFGLRTVGVMGTGFQQIYPKSNTELVEEMLTMNGSVLSEFFYYSKSDRHNFPIRNKVIAGLADATIVVETAVKGGSMITAHLANSYHRMCLQFPGYILIKTHDGCHELFEIIGCFDYLRNGFIGDDELEFGGQTSVNANCRELDADEEPIVKLIEKKKSPLLMKLLAIQSIYGIQSNFIY